MHIMCESRIALERNRDKKTAPSSLFCPVFLEGSAMLEMSEVKT